MRDIRPGADGQNEECVSVLSRYDPNKLGRLYTENAEATLIH